MLRNFFLGHRRIPKEGAVPAPSVGPASNTLKPGSTPLRVLSIDGGGIRGILPACILAELERQSGRPIVDLFDLIVGTSTGGLLALALTIPGSLTNRPRYAAKDIIKFYEEEGKRIFTRSVWHQIRSVGSLAEGKYPTAGIEEVLREYFGEARLKDTLSNVMIPAYEIERRIPFFFRSWMARDSEESDFAVRDIIRAATAAPTYFEPARIQARDSSDYFAFVDGALFAYNPSMCAFVEAIEQTRNQHDLLMVSLGSGELTQRLPYDEVKEWGAAKWAQPIFSLMCDGNCDIVDHQMRLALSDTETGKRYFRFQATLEAGSEDMDNASKHNMRTLKLLGEDFVSLHRETLHHLAKRLLESAAPMPVPDNSSPAAVADEHPRDATLVPGRKNKFLGSTEDFWK